MAKRKTTARKGQTPAQREAVRQAKQTLFTARELEKYGLRPLNSPEWVARQYRNELKNLTEQQRRIVEGSVERRENTKADVVQFLRLQRRQEQARRAFEDKVLAGEIPATSTARYQIKTNRQGVFKGFEEDEDFSLNNMPSMLPVAHITANRKYLKQSIADATQILTKGEEKFRLDIQKKIRKAWLAKADYVFDDDLNGGGLRYLIGKMTPEMFEQFAYNDGMVRQITGRYMYANGDHDFEDDELADALETMKDHAKDILREHGVQFNRNA